MSKTESESIDAILSLAVELLDHLQGKNPLAFRVACSRFRRAIDERDPPKESPPSGRIDTDRMTIDEAYEFSRRKIGFGKYADLCYGDCPREYLDWLVETKKTEWLTLLRFLKSCAAPDRYYGDDDRE